MATVHAADPIPTSPSGLAGLMWELEQNTKTGEPDPCIALWERLHAQEGYDVPPRSGPPPAPTTTTTTTTPRPDHPDGQHPPAATHTHHGDPMTKRTAREEIERAFHVSFKLPDQAAELLDAYRAEVLAEAADHLDRIADEVEAKVAAYYGPASGIGPGSAGHVRMDAQTIRALAGIKPTEDPIIANWDHAVIHPDDPAEPTIVCCRTDNGQPVALVLDPEHREALGLQLVDPDGQ
nr:hypothetical protein KitaXyl93_20520 [Kitasatospora sp. Xyl93]